MVRLAPGVFNERMFVYLCTDLVPGATDLQPDERLTPVVVPWSRGGIRMVTDGRIEDAKTMLALLLCDRLRAR